MKAADEGKLSDLEVLTAQARRMLQDPRARKQSSRFIEEWLDLAREYMRFADGASDFLFGRPLATALSRLGCRACPGHAGGDPGFLR